VASDNTGLAKVVKVANPFAPNGAKYENVKNSFESGIIAPHFGGKYASLLLPVFEEAWRTRYASFI